MEDRIIANSKQLYCIARELDAVHESLRKMQYLLADNNEMCHHLGFVGVEPAATECDRTIQETIEAYHKLWCKLVISSEQYMQMIEKSMPPLTPPIIFPDFKN